MDKGDPEPDPPVYISHKHKDFPKSHLFTKHATKKEKAGSCCSCCCSPFNVLCHQADEYCEEASLHGLKYIGDNNRHWFERYENGTVVGHIFKLGSASHAMHGLDR